MFLRRLILPMMSCFMAMPAIADECASFKLKPDVTLSAPNWTKSVVQPLGPMYLWHGNVVATLVDNYDIVADVTSVEDGFCVGLKAVNAEIGYEDFLVQIDIRHAPDTCSYNAILSHEDGHIRAYLSVIDDYQNELKSAVYSAADSVMPVFVPRAAEIDAAIAVLNEQIQSHPDVILIKQKISAAQEMRNKRIDQNDNGTELKKCFVMQ